jgi:AraC-like DNA-binding protein
MEFETQYITPDIKLSQFGGRYFKTEVMFDHHILVWLMAGETRIIQAEQTCVFSGGDVFLLPRNQLTTIINKAHGDTLHKAVAMHLTIDRLKDFYTRHTASGKLQTLQQVHHFAKHPLLESCLASLLYYFELGENLPLEIADIKIEEAITILRSIDKRVDCMLANFEEPGKINLSAFMERNYMFNMPLDKFAYLTGRSLATYRRDFAKIYNTTPQKWLTQKRLQLAHYQIAEKKQRPGDVYFEVGFENLSHFSHAFKTHFGYSPGSLVGK